MSLLMFVCVCAGGGGGGGGGGGVALTCQAEKIDKIILQYKMCP